MGNGSGNVCTLDLEMGSSVSTGIRAELLLRLNTDNNFCVFSPQVW